jgi:hypothetical protein
MTFASFLTPEGIVGAAALITGLISLLRNSVPRFAEIPGALVALVLSALLYLATALVVGIATPDVALTVLASWIAAGTAAVGAYEAVTKPVGDTIRSQQARDG